MEKELIINSSPSKVEVALLEDGKLVELHQQKTSNKFVVGDIFLGRVQKLMPSLNAAFVDIGHRKDAFLHYTDLGPPLRSLQKWVAQVRKGTLHNHLLDHFDFEGEIIKTGKINQVLNKKSPILVQVLKEPISTKGPRLSCELTIPGRFLVLIPFSNAISISKKIASAEERSRLKTLINSIRPKNFGVIIRTASEGKKTADLHVELMELVEKWKNIYQQLKTVDPPIKLLSEIGKTNSILRDMLTTSFNRIITNDKALEESLRTYMKQIAPDQAKIIAHYKSAKPIFDTMGVNKQIKSSFGKTSTMKSGAYLVIEHTEAMHVIDVNSGPKVQRTNQEEAALAVNLESAKEIARQLRLRDLGGLIVVDFIDMKKHENRVKLLTTMREAMSQDRAQNAVLPLSKFGLMQITRQRVRPEVKIEVQEQCSTCGGSGKMTASILVTDEIERDLEFIFNNMPNVKLSLSVHPFLAAYFKKGILGRKWKWYKKYKNWIKIKEDHDLPLIKYKFYDDKDEEIRLT